MIKDMSLKSQPCGTATHLWKYTIFNTTFCFFTCATFFLFPGGGEGARARAMVIAIFHAAFATWGALMWLYVSDDCDTVFTNQYQTVWAYQHISVGHNILFFILFSLHETLLGKHLKADLTLMSEIHPASYSALPTNGQGVQAPGVHSPAPDQLQMPGVHGGPGHMAPEISEGYNDILKSPAGNKSTPVHLPQGSP